MKQLLLFFVLTAFSSSIFAQVRGRPAPTPLTPAEKADQRATDITQRSGNLRNVENFPVKNDGERIKIRNEVIKPLYRKPTKAEMTILAPDPEDLSKNAIFLKQKKVGLIKLVADRGCAANTKVIKASIDCASYTMPGAGSAYSFRVKTYRLIRLADLNFRNNSLQALGTLAHGIMSNLGDIPLEELTLESKGVAYVTKFESAREMNAAAEIANKLTKGIKDGDFIYGSVLRAKLNSTYILRSIAYRGEALKTVNGYLYNELEFDKRRDVTVAFRIVRLDPGKSVTILWRELKSKKSPKIRMK